MEQRLNARPLIEELAVLRRRERPVWELARFRSGTGLGLGSRSFWELVQFRSGTGLGLGSRSFWELARFRSGTGLGLGSRSFWELVQSRSWSWHRFSLGVGSESVLESVRGLSWSWWGVILKLLSVGWVEVREWVRSRGSRPTLY